jgi:spore germination cell wall hydrolase CwlJ-like protein
MIGKILALLFYVALTGASGAAQAHDTFISNASAEAVAEVENNPALPPTAGRDDFGAIIASWKEAIKSMFDPSSLPRACLATAIYFEARSESQLGQLAVATVILNRAHASHYPSSICGVVYQGASRLNACQFSFACDGQSHLPQNGQAWDTAVAIAVVALAIDKPLQIVATATCYHADYVDPTWSKSLHRVAKIGRHIFYSQI